MTQFMHSENKAELLLLVALFTVESSLAIMAVAMHMKSERPFGEFLASKPGLFFLGAIIAAVMGGAVIVNRYLAHTRWPSRRFRSVVTMNLVTVLFIAITGEIVLRVGTQSTPAGETFLNVSLKPKSWDQLRERALKVHEEYQTEQPVIVPDPQLGWTVGSNRYRASKSNQPPYASSVDGLRAPEQEVRYDGIQGGRAIALIGDSYTFGDKVGFEETWGHKLDQLLGDDYRVLNFGVPGYSLGQAYRRYMRDAAPRHAKVVVFSLIDDDLVRTMRVYPFVFYSSWRLPFSKPRFFLQDGELKEANKNVIPFTQVLAAEEISELPFVRYDIGYNPNDWEERWYHVSYLVRLITSLFPKWTEGRPEVSEETMLSLNTEIIKAFIRSVEQAGTIPLIVWFPDERNFQEPSSHQPIGKRMLKQAGISYIDPTPCLLELNPADRFIGGHYSPQGNTAVLKCLVGAVHEALATPPSGYRRKVREKAIGSDTGPIRGTSSLYGMVISTPTAQGPLS